MLQRLGFQINCKICGRTVLARLKMEASMVASRSLGSFSP